MRSAFVVLGISLLAAGCGGPEPTGDSASEPTQGNAKLVVYTVNYPLQYFAERIGGGAVEVVFPAPPDGDPAYWSPDGEAVGAFQQADLILLNGAGYAKWVDKVTLPPSKLVDTSTAFKDRFIVVEGAVTHSHGPGGEHSHGETAFTTWLDLSLAIEQAKAIRDALSKGRPQMKASFEEGYTALERDLLELDERIRALSSTRSDTSLLGSHPVYQYLARGYELDIRSVHFEPHELPDGDAWRDLEHLLAERPAKWMLWEGRPVGEIVAKLKALGVESVIFDPCGNKPSEGDFLSVMKENVAGLEKLFS